MTDLPWGQRKTKMEVYYKATLKDGFAKEALAYTQKPYQYHIGLNVLPDWKWKSTEPCGHGLHLGKFLKDWYGEEPPPSSHSQYYLTEFYIARPGVILGEDSVKVRCGYVFLDRRLTREECRGIVKREQEDIALERGMDNFMRSLPTSRFVDDDWIKHSRRTFTQADYEAQGMTVITPTRTMTLKTTHKKGEIRTALKYAINKRKE